MDTVLLQQRHRRAKKERVSPNYELIFLLVVVRQLADVLNFNLHHSLNVSCRFEEVIWHDFGSKIADDLRNNKADDWLNDLMIC